MTLRLPWRLFISYALVIAVGAAVSWVTIQLLAPAVFDHEMTMLGGDHMGMGGLSGNWAGTGPPSSVRSAFGSALTTALLVGMLASVAAAAVAAAFVTSRLVRPLTAVRAATRRIADGQYQASVPVPREPELAALAADVNTLAARLADTEKRRTRLLGEVAHEMRTPLTALDGYLEGLIDGVFAPEPEVLQAASDEVRRLRRLSDDLSALSKAEEQRLDLHPADADLADLARRAAGRLAPQFSDSDVTLTVDAAAALPVLADQDRVTQVLTNLLGNALTATPAGGTVTIAARVQGRSAQVTVTDTGVGLAASDLERIFERFYRAPGQPRRSAGSGIGLTIARNIARAHGGDVAAASPGPGKGATFTLTLPLRSHGGTPRELLTISLTVHGGVPPRGRAGLAEPTTCVTPPVNRKRAAEHAATVLRCTSQAIADVANRRVRAWGDLAAGRAVLRRPSGSAWRSPTRPGRAGWSAPRRSGPCSDA